VIGDLARDLTNEVGIEAEPPAPAVGPWVVVATCVRLKEECFSRQAISVRTALGHVEQCTCEHLAVEPAF
jgi:hypothetical protein